MADKKNAPRKTKGTTTVDMTAVARKQREKVGPTVRLRAIRRGFYGVKVADLREPGDEFAMAVKHLEPWKDGGEYADGTPKRKITVDGKDYALPSWCIDPKAVDEDELDEDFDDEGDGAPAGASPESDSVI